LNRGIGAHARASSASQDADVTFTRALAMLVAGLIVVKIDA